MTQEELVVAETVAEKLDKYLLYGGQDMPEKGSYLNDSWPMPSLRQQRKRKGTVVCCVGCGGVGITLYKCDLGYICKTCKKKREEAIKQWIEEEK